MFADTRLVLVDIQAPNDEEETIIIGGDFNCTLTDIDKKGGNPFSRKIPVIQEVNKLYNIYELTDIWRQRDPNEEKFT